MKKLLVVAVAVLSPTLARADFKRLYSDTAVASSYLQNDWNKYQQNYHPNYALDDDPKTAWVEGHSGDGLGESLTIRVSPLPKARAVRLRIRNGYQKSAALLAANAAPEKMDIELLDPTGDVTVKRLVTLEKKDGWQEFDVTVPDKAGFALVRLTIVSAHPGTRYKDTCISDVQVLVDTDVPYNPKAEAAKKAALQAWIKERVQTARYFAKLPKQYPFSSTHFDPGDTTQKRREKYVGGEGGHLDKSFVPLSSVIPDSPPQDYTAIFDKDEQQLIKRLLDHVRTKGEALAPRWYQVTFKQRVKLPDGLEGNQELVDVADYLDRTSFALFEAPGEKGVTRMPASVEGHPEMVLAWFVSNARVGFHPAKAPSGVENAPTLAPAAPAVSEVYFWQRTLVDERSSYENRTHFLVQYDEQERPTRVAVFNDGTDQWAVSLFVFGLDDAGRIATVRRKSAAFVHYDEIGDFEDANTFSDVMFKAHG